MTSGSVIIKIFVGGSLRNSSKSAYSSGSHVNMGRITAGFFIQAFNIDFIVYVNINMKTKTLQMS